MIISGSMLDMSLYDQASTSMNYTRNETNFLCSSGVMDFPVLISHGLLVVPGSMIVVSFIMEV